MILKIVIVVVILIAVILVFAATKPATLHVQRSMVVNAPPEKVFALVNDLRRWQQWEPQEDSTTTRTFSGAPSGVGAASEWNSRGRAGKGKMSVIESQPSSRVVVKVDFLKPFESHNMNEFMVAPADGATKVTWSWQGQNLYFMKVMGIFVNMDRMIGKHFEDGLAKMKRVAEQ